MHITIALRRKWLTKFLCSFTIAAAVGSGGCVVHKGPVPQSRFAQIHPLGDDSRNGYFDISVEYGNDGVGWLTYSRVEVPEYVETHLARSSDHGKSWRYVKALNHSAAGSAVVEGKRVEGVWRYETSTLLFDPKDIPARRWKLFVHRYLTLPPYERDDRLFDRSWIEYRYAARPDGQWSKGECLFGKQDKQCRVDLTALHPDLRGFSHFSELGSVEVNGTLYISMDASVTKSGLGEWEERKVVLVFSRDHGVTWQYAGTLTGYEDASEFGYVTMTGSSLVKENGRIFLLLTPSGRKGLLRKNRGHDGTLVIEFEDVRQAKLKRDARGRLMVLKTINPDLNSGGLSDYDEQNSVGGILFSQINMPATPGVFQIFSTQQRLTR